MTNINLTGRKIHEIVATAVTAGADDYFVIDVDNGDTTYTPKKIKASSLGSSGAVSSFTSVNPSGITLDGATDVAIPLEAELRRIGDLGGGTLKLISPDGIYINQIAVIEDSNVTLDLTECPVILGTNGALAIYGDLAETPASSKPKLYSAITSGATSFEIVVYGANVTPAAGQQFTLRGENDGTGNTINKEQGIIATATSGAAFDGGVRWVITTVTPIEESYEIRYVDSGYEQAGLGNDFSFFTINSYSNFTGDIAAGTTSVQVTDSSFFAVGDYVFVNDTSSVSTYANDVFGITLTNNNKIRREINRILAIDSGTDTITLTTPLFHQYQTAYGGGLTKINATVNSHIIGARCRFGAADGGAKRHSIIFKYAVDCSRRYCSVEYSTIVGVNYGHVGNAMRFENSLNCSSLFCTVIAKPDAGIYSSGQGYGHTYIGCTSCLSIGDVDQNTRHGHLFQNGAVGNVIIGMRSQDCRISALDFHGQNARHNIVISPVLIGGRLLASGASNKAAIRFGNTTHIVGDHDNKVFNSECVNWELPSGSGYGVDIVTPSTGNIVQGGSVDGCDYGIGAKFNTSRTTIESARNTVKDFVIRAAANGCLDVDGGTNRVVTDLRLERVQSSENTIHFESESADGITFDGLTVRNSVPTSGRYAAKFTNCLGVEVIGCDFDGSNRGVSLRESPSAQIIGNRFRNQTETRVFNDDTTAGNNNGYIFEDNSYAGTATPSFTLSTSTGRIIDQIGVNGATGSRPTLPAGSVGYQYFDTTLNQLIVWNGTVWKDGSGATV